MRARSSSSSVSSVAPTASSSCSSVETPTMGTTPPAISQASTTWFGVAPSSAGHAPDAESRSPLHAKPRVSGLTWSPLQVGFLVT